jgi:hypothetical protein
VLARSEADRQRGFASTSHIEPSQAGDYGSFGPRAREDRRCPKLPRTPQEFSRRVPYICAHVFLGSDQRKDRGYRAGGPAHRVTKAKKEPMARRPLAYAGQRVRPAPPVGAARGACDAYFPLRIGCTTVLLRPPSVGDTTHLPSSFPLIDTAPLRCSDNPSSRHHLFRCRL